jgi:hypothetical protein
VGCSLSYGFRINKLGLEGEDTYVLAATPTTFSRLKLYVYVFFAIILHLIYKVFNLFLALTVKPLIIAK